VALEHLLAALERDAEAEIARIEAEARRTAAALAAESDTAAATRRDAGLAERERALRAAGAAALAVVRREARRAVLEARHAVIEQVMAVARRRLPAALETPAFRERLPAWFAAGVAAVAGERRRVRSAPGLAAPLRRLAAAVGIPVIPDPLVATGFRVESEQLAVDVTLETLLERRRAALTIALLRDLERDA
jgi:vacuolar-type H+-ATPase subunit E/Vma4